MTTNKRAVANEIDGVAGLWYDSTIERYSPSEIGTIN
jgi:hypothetical protein